MIWLKFFFLNYTHKNFFFFLNWEFLYFYKDSKINKKKKKDLQQVSFSFLKKLKIKEKNWDTDE